MARSSALAKLLLAVAFGVAVRQLLPETFVQPGRRQVASALAMGLLAGQVAAPQAAEAAGQAGPRFSFFGFGGGENDVYSLNDNPNNPYSQFSPEENSVYSKMDKSPFIEKKAAQLRTSLKAFDVIPEFIRTKQPEEIKMKLDQQMYEARRAMEYISGGPGTANFALARDFLQSLSSLNMHSERKEWAQATGDYEEMMRKLSDWKRATNFS